MSYEGYAEYLCVNGHHSSVDAYSDNLRWCNYCGEALRYRHAVDQTNGTSPASKDPKCYTRSAPKTEIGADLLWRTDKFGNPYATEVFKYKPARNRSGDIWGELSQRALTHREEDARNKIKEKWELDTKVPVAPAATPLAELDDLLSGDWDMIDLDSEEVAKLIRRVKDNLPRTKLPTKT